ncbi:MAG: serine hydrolase [Coxiellaceae bacterium]|nr:serine hydrolase [Coxiellaceae bacterium]
MRHAFACFIGLIFSVTAFATNPLQARLNLLVARGYNVGISVAVVTPQSTQYYHAGKLSKQPGAKSVDQNTLFQIASISKVMTSLMTAEAVKQGKLKLSNPVNDYLPKSMQLTDFKNIPITISDCVAHLAGFPSNPTNFVSTNPQNMFQGYTEKDFIKYIRAFRPTVKPGSKYRYSNVGYALTGLVLTQLYHHSYSDLLKDNVTTPLNMSRTFVDIPAKDLSDVATAYGSNDQIVPYMNLGAIVPAGGVTSNTADLSQFVRAFMGIKKTKLYPAMQLAIQPIASEGLHSKDGNFSGRSSMSISMGWNIDPEHSAVWKNGNLAGVSSFVGFSNDKKIGVVVLTNTGNVSYTDNLALHILDPMLKYMPLYQQIDQPKSINQRYTGTYQVAKHEAYLLQAHDGLIAATHVRDGRTSRPFNIYPMSATKYFGKVDNAVFSFQVNKKGQPKGFVLNENSHITHAVLMTAN